MSQFRTLDELIGNKKFPKSLDSAPGTSRMTKSKFKGRTKHG